MYHEQDAWACPNLPGCPFCSAVHWRKWKETGILPSVLLLYTVPVLDFEVSSPPIPQWYSGMGWKVGTANSKWDTLVQSQSINFLLW